MGVGEGNSSTRDARAMAIAEKRSLACRLRIAGLTYDQIAKELKLKSRSSARDLVVAAIKEHTREPAEEVRDREIERLDELLRGMWAKAKSGSVQHVDRVIKIMERRARYLGLDAPEKFEHNIPSARATAAQARAIMSEEFPGGVTPTDDTDAMAPVTTAPTDEPPPAADVAEEQDEEPTDGA